MGRQYWRAANLLNPVPAVMITCADEEGRANVMTAAWAGTICSDPVMVSVSIRKERYSHDIIERTGEFVINLTNEKLVKAADFVGVRSGRDIDKFALEKELKLTQEKSKLVKAPCIKESPVCLECRVKEILRLGSHDMFLAEVVSTDIDEAYLDENGRLDLKKARLVAYSHGEYYALGKLLGSFGYSVRKKKSGAKDSEQKKTPRKKKQADNSVPAKRRKKGK